MIALLTLTLLGGAENGVWPQFRGPSGQGQVAGSLPLRWSDEEHVAWRCKLPDVGHSSPVIWDETAWLTTATKDGTKLSLLGVDLASGRLTHNILLFEPTDIHKIHHSNSYASPTPCVDSQRVYAHFGRYGTAAVNTSTGEIVWKNETINVTHNSGPASSPVLACGRLVLVFDAIEESFVCGLDPETGEMVWKTPRSAPLREKGITHRAFSTPLMIRRDGTDYVVIPGPDQMNCYVASSGKELWQVRYTGFSTVPAPASDGERLFYCTGFFDAELRGLSLDKLFTPTNEVRDVTGSHSLWAFARAVSDTPSPTYHNGRVWMVSDTGVLTSVDAETGERLSVGRVRDNVSASPLVTDEHLYVFGESGTTTVWDLTAESPAKVATNELSHAIKASPAVVDNTLLIRTARELIRIDAQPER